MFDGFQPCVVGTVGSCTNISAINSRSNACGGCIHGEFPYIILDSNCRNVANYIVLQLLCLMMCRNCLRLIAGFLYSLYMTMIVKCFLM